MHRFYATHSITHLGVDSIAHMGIDSRLMLSPNKQMFGQSISLHRLYDAHGHRLYDAYEQRFYDALRIDFMTHMGIDNVTLMGIYFMMHAGIMCVRNGLQPMTRWAEVLRRIQAKIL